MWPEWVPFKWTWTIKKKLACNCSSVSYGGYWAALSAIWLENTKLWVEICSPLFLYIFCLMGTSIVFSTSEKGSLLVTWPVKQRQVAWTRGRALNLHGGASAATVHLLPFPACQINSPADLVPQLHADKRHSWKAGQPGPVWRNSIIAAEKRRSRRQD